MRVRQTSGEFDLALEPRCPLRARRLMQDLERNEPAMTLVAREVYRGLTALPQLPLDRVATGQGRAQALLLHLGDQRRRKLHGRAGFTVKLLVEPRLRTHPLAGHGARRHGERFSGLRLAQPGEETTLHDLGEAGIDLPESIEC